MIAGVRPAPVDGRASSRGGGGFVPTMLSGLALWLRADMGLAQTGNVLTSWTDQSPNGFVFNSAPATNTMPGYSPAGGPNGRPCVTFSGSQSLTSAANPLIGGNGTLFITLSSGVAAQNPAFVFYAGTNTTLVAACLANRDLRTVGGDLTNGVVTTNWEEWTLQSSGATQLNRWNGSNQVTSATTAGSPQTGGTGIGDYISKNHSFAGSIWEILLYNRGLSAIEIQMVEEYVRMATAIW